MSTAAIASPVAAGGRFDFDDGGTFCGGWADGKAHGHGVCTGPKGQGEYSGTWTGGFEVSGVYTWPTGTTYEGQWESGKRHGLGVETRGRWIFRGEWTEGFKGRYGVRQSISSIAKYDGTWANGLQDGYGSETYADGGTFQGQWAKGMRHGYGVRSSAPFGLAAHTRRQSIRRSPDPESSTLDRRMEEGRGGFVLKDSRGTWGKSEQTKGSALKALMTKKKRSGASYEEEGEPSDEGSDATDSSFVVQDESIDSNVIETYMGEWKNDKRSGFGIAERSDGIKYEGEWHNNKKFGYGRTTYKNGIVENGKYKNNFHLVDKRNIFRSAKNRERVEAAVNGAHRSSQIALQKADIAISRTATARGKAEQADATAKHARSDSDVARLVAKNYAPEFQQPGTEFLKKKFVSSQDSSDFGNYPSGEDPSHRSFPSSNPADPRDYYPKPDYDGVSYLSPEPPPQSAFLGLFSNNPDRRPSAAGFLRRPSAIHLRRPSTVIELSIVPSQFDQHPADQDYHRYQQPQLSVQQDQHRTAPNYQQNRYQPPQLSFQQFDQHQTSPNYHQNRYQPPQLSLQQVIDEHFCHYYDFKRSSEDWSSVNCVRKKPAIDLTELSKLYGIPLSKPLTEMDDEENSAPFIPQRRLTMPTVMDQNLLQVDGSEGMVRTSSLYTRKLDATSKGSAVVSARKKSLPDITSPSFVEPRILTRETIAVLSSQRRETIRREEEEAERLRANPFLYLLSPEVWDWFASKQLVILVVVINVALGFIFFKVIL